MHAAVATRRFRGCRIDPWPLSPYRCSVASCRMLWHEMTVRPPLQPAVEDLTGIARHPCPWCLSESPLGSRTAHRALARELGA